MNICEIFDLLPYVILHRLLVFDVCYGLIYIVIQNLRNVCDDITL